MHVDALLPRWHEKVSAPPPGAATRGIACGMGTWCASERGLLRLRLLPRQTAEPLCFGLPWLPGPPGETMPPVTTHAARRGTSVEWAPEKLSWADFRGKVLGLGTWSLGLLLGTASEPALASS